MTMNLQRGLAKRRFITSTLTLMSGTVFAQLVTVATAPILSRLFAPAEFAVLGVFVAALAVMTSIAGFRYELSIVTAKTLQAAAAAFSTAIIILIAIAAIFAAIAWLLPGEVARMFNAPALEHVVWLFPFALLFSGGQLIQSFWVTRKGTFLNQSLSEVARSVVAAASQLVLGLVGAGAKGLVIGQCIGLAASMLVITGAVSKDAGLLARSLSLTRISFAARRYSNYALYQTPKAIVNALTNNLPVILLTIFFDPVVAGLCWFVQRLLQMPLRLVGQTVQRVFFKTSADLHRGNHPLFKPWAGSTLMLISIGAIIAATIVITGPQVFGWIFGAKWRDGWQYAVALAIWLTFQLGSAPAQSIYILAGRQRLQFLLEASAAMVRIAIIPLGAGFLSAIQTIWAYSLAGAILNLTVISLAGYLAWRRMQLLKSPVQTT